MVALTADPWNAVRDRGKYCTQKASRKYTGQSPVLKAAHARRGPLNRCDRPLDRLSPLDRNPE